MSYQKKPAKQSQPAARAQRHGADYQAMVDENIKWLNSRNVVVTKLESKEFPDTGGTRWTATVTVEYNHPHLKPGGLALKLVNFVFPGVYMPKLWEVRHADVPTFEISWFTNDLD